MSRTVRRFLLPLSALVLSLGFASKAGATALTIGDARFMGYIEFGIPSGDASRTAYVNFLIDMAPSTGPSAFSGQSITRSANVLCYPTCADAVFAGNGTGTTVVAGFRYLFAKYDGPNYGSVVWEITGLTSITIPGTAGDQGYGLSGWTVFNQTTTQPPCDPNSTVPAPGCQNFNPVPEPATLALLGTGLALAAFGLRRRATKS